MKIRKFKPEEWKEIIQVWNHTLRGDPITESIFLNGLLLDPNYDRDGFRVVEVGGKIKAIAIGWHQVANNLSENALAENKDRGFLFPLLIDDSREGLEYGQELLRDIDNYFKELGKKTIHICGLNPLFPDGVDSEKGLLYVNNGYCSTGKIYSMRVDLYRFQIDDHVMKRIFMMGKENFTFTHYRPDDMSAIIDFFVGESSTGFQFEFQKKIHMGAPHDEFMFVKKGNQVVGYCQHNHYCQQPERVGPFLIAKSMRGQKIGQAMVAKLLESMTRKGFHTAYFNSCTEENSYFYAKNGFKVFREKTIFQKNCNYC